MGPPGTPVEDGWTWKFDPAIYGSARLVQEYLTEVQCLAAFIAGERGLTTRELTGRSAASQPIALVAALQVLLGQ